MKSMNKNNCSRCDSVNSDGTIPKTESLESFLQKTYFTEICNTCTHSLENLLLRATENPFPEKGMPMIENVHYYIENDFWVFTELYHASRGFCCKNGCRHCAYGFKKEKI
jgi:hypothetical protein